MRTFENYHKVYRYIIPLNHSAPDYQTNCQIQNAFLYLEDYLNLTTNQYRRIANNMAELGLLPCSGNLVRRNMLILFGDMHFMFVALEKAYKLSFKLLKLLNEHSLYEEFRTSPAFVAVKQIRNCLEHMDENLTNHDDRFNECVNQYDDYVNWFTQQWGMMIDDEITLGKYSFSLCEESFSPVWYLYDVILENIHNKYVAKNKELYDKIFRFPVD